MLHVRRLLILAGLAVPLAAAACATTRPVATQVDDATLTSRVKTRLAADPDVRAMGIDVDTIDGVVTLRGNVEQVEDRQIAEDIANGVSGVRRVDNQIKVGADVDLFDGNPDRWITTKVKAQIAGDEAIKARNIDVDTDDRVVTLSGVVESEQAKQRAEEVARSVEGVTKVDNQLRVDATAAGASGDGDMTDEGMDEDMGDHDMDEGMGDQRSRDEAEIEVPPIPPPPAREENQPEDA